MDNRSKSGGWFRAALTTLASLFSFASANASAASDEAKPLTIEQRVERVRQHLADTDAAGAPPKLDAEPPSHQSVQWPNYPNWPNWPNWNNWRNWNNWNNWVNWWNG